MSILVKLESTGTANSSLVMTIVVVVWKRSS